tara:strand:- start:402 stop:773 length:372 start_codon:yes stop_codon:yes gene_type:complete
MEGRAVVNLVHQSECGSRPLGFRSKLETQIIQLDFDDLRVKHLIEVSESIRLYTSEYGYSLEDVADVLGIPLELARRMHAFLDNIQSIPETTSARNDFLKSFGVESMRKLYTEYDGIQECLHE